MKTINRTTIIWQPFLLAAIFFCVIKQPAFAQENERTKDSLRQSVMLGNDIRSHYLRCKPYFDKAYSLFPGVPRGVLEAVAFTYNRFSPQGERDTVELDNNAIPRTYGLMGLTLNGKGVFRENLRRVSQLSGAPVPLIVSDDSLAVLAYAKAYAQLQVQFGCVGKSMREQLQVLTELSELPLRAPDVRNFALKSSLYEICWSMAHLDSMLPDLLGETVCLQNIFGADLAWLEVGDLLRTDQSVQADGPDYFGSLWVPAAACNYSKGRTQPVSNVTIHYTQGTYSGAIAWFQNCAASASAHYVIRSFDGQVTQMVRETDKAWHVGSSNGYTIGIEHEAYGNIASFFTPAMYASSANLVKDITNRYPDISTHRTFYRDTLDDGTALNAGIHSLGGRTACTQIRGHQHYPDQTHTDPGPSWNWNYYYKLLNPATPIAVCNAWSGVLTDDGGETGNYEDGIRRLYLVDVGEADSVSMEFTAFDLESNYDFLWIYAGSTPFSPLVGRWNTYSPGRVVVPGGQLLLEFRSDCADNSAGWVANWHGIRQNVSMEDAVAPATAIAVDENAWVTRDFVASFQDHDNSGVECRFFQIMEKSNGQWRASGKNGFLCDNFDNETSLDYWHCAGSWTVHNHTLEQQDMSATNATAFTPHSVAGHDAHLYDFYLTFQQGESFSFYWDCADNDVNSLSFCGFQMVLNKSGNSLDIYRIDHGVKTRLVHRTQVYHTWGQSYLYRVLWERDGRRIRVFRHNTQLVDVSENTDPGDWQVRYVGFATQLSRVAVDNVRAYASRTSSVAVSVGGGEGKMLRAQALSGVATCKLKSVVVDSAGNFSSIAEKSLKVDYTPPIMPRTVGLQFLESSDRDISSVVAEWSPCTDRQSGIRSYQYRFQLFGANTATQRETWSDNGLRTSVRECLQLRVGNMVRVQVQVSDNAGNVSLTANSIYLLKVPQREFAKSLQRSLEGNLVCEFYSLAGQLMLISQIDNVEVLRMRYGEMEGLPSGVYVLRILQDGRLVETGKYVVP